MIKKRQNGYISGVLCIKNGKTGTYQPHHAQSLGFFVHDIWGNLAKLVCNTGKAERVNMKKKELFGKIEELEHEIDLLKERVELLEKRPPVVTYPTLPEPQKLPINPWSTLKDVPICPPFIFYC